VKVTAIYGAAEVRARLKAAGVKSGVEIERGLKRAGLYLQRLSQKVVPVLTGALKNSAGTRMMGHGFHSVAVVFYTQVYAVYVHERTELRHKAGKQAKFLEEPAKTHKEDILRIIAGGRASGGGGSGGQGKWANQYGSGGG
jgi:hypothetical protein